MTIEGLIIWLIVGAIAGWLAGLIVKGYGFGLIGNIVVGIIGAVIAGWLLPRLGIVIGSGYHRGDHQRHDRRCHLAGDHRVGTTLAESRLSIYASDREMLPILPAPPCSRRQPACRLHAAGWGRSRLERCRCSHEQHWGFPPWSCVNFAEPSPSSNTRVFCIRFANTGNRGPGLAFRRHPALAASIDSFGPKDDALGIGAGRWNYPPSVYWIANDPVRENGASHEDDFSSQPRLRSRPSTAQPAIRRRHAGQGATAGRRGVDLGRLVYRRQRRL